MERDVLVATAAKKREPRTCPCGKRIDPVGLHLLHCKQNHYGCLHDSVRYAVAARFRSFMHFDAAAFSVLIEQPMLPHFGLCNAAAPEGVALIADLIVLLHSDLELEPIACDFVSCFVKDKRVATHKFWMLPFASSDGSTQSIYLTLTGNGFYPLPFGRSNVMASEIIRFCT